MSIKFNCEESKLMWFNLTYQSNDLLNDALDEKKHMTIKVFIAEKLVKLFQTNWEPIERIESHVHGNIIFAIQGTITLIRFNEVVNLLRQEFIPYTPNLLFNLSIVGISKINNNWKSFMYIEGSETLNENFKNDISSFFPLDEPS